MSDKRTTLDDAVASIESGMTIGIGERSSTFVESGWAGDVPGQETVYNQNHPPPQFIVGQPGCQNWRPSITSVLVHGRHYVPNAVNGSPASFHSNHTSGGNFLLMDGSCRFIRDSINLPVFRALCTRVPRLLQELVAHRHIARGQLIEVQPLPFQEHTPVA